MSSNVVTVLKILVILVVIIDGVLCSPRFNLLRLERMKDRYDKRDAETRRKISNSIEHVIQEDPNPSPPTTKQETTTKQVSTTLKTTTKQVPTTLKTTEAATTLKSTLVTKPSSKSNSHTTIKSKKTTKKPTNTLVPTIIPHATLVPTIIPHATKAHINNAEEKQKILSETLTDILLKIIDVKDGEESKTNLLMKNNFLSFAVNGLLDKVLKDRDIIKKLKNQLELKKYN